MATSRQVGMWAPRQRYLPDGRQSARWKVFETAAANRAVRFPVFCESFPRPLPARRRDRESALRALPDARSHPPRKDRDLEKETSREIDLSLERYGIPLAVRR